MKNNKRIILYIIDHKLRHLLKNRFSKNNYDPVLTSSPKEISNLGPTKDIILLETFNDVALLNQIVYQLHFDWMGEVPKVIAILSKEALYQNPAVGMWVINDHNALLSLVHNTQTELDHIVDLVDRMQ